MKRHPVVYGPLGLFTIVIEVSVSTDMSVAVLIVLLGCGDSSSGQERWSSLGHLEYHLLV